MVWFLLGKSPMGELSGDREGRTVPFSVLLHTSNEFRLYWNKKNGYEPQKPPTQGKGEICNYLGEFYLFFTYICL